MTTGNGSFVIFQSLEFKGNDLGHLKKEAEELVSSLKSRDKDCDKKTLIPIFRGEPERYNSPLQPSIFREMVKENIRSDHEKSLFNFFLNRYPNYKYDDPLKSLSIMQHYGFPTRLLDWTSQLEVALWFACNMNPDGAGVLYVFVPTMTYQKGESFVEPLQAFHDSIKYHYFKQVLIPHTEEAHTEFWNELSKLASADLKNTAVPWWMVFKPEIVNEVNQREQWQRSVFTFHQGYVNGDKLQAAPATLINKFIKQHIAQLIIPAKVKKKILMSLRDKGVCVATLFPEPTYYREEYA